MAVSNMTAVTDTNPQRLSSTSNYLSASFSTDDTDNHDFRFDAAGRSKSTIAVDNRANQIITITVYGSQTSTAEVSGNNVFQVGQFTVATTTSAYETFIDPFPFYLVRMTYSVTPSTVTTTLYVNLID